MNIRDLKYLVKLAETKHFGKAAQACFVSQPTLSMQIKKLEEELGTQLVERNNKSVLFTEIGTRVVDYAKQMLASLDDLKQYIDTVKNPYQGKLTVGVIPTLGPYLLPHIIPKLTRTFPDLKIYLHEAQTVTLVEMLTEGELDAIILALPVPDTNFVVKSLFREPFVLAVPTSHAFANQKYMHADKLENQDVLLLAEGHCLRDQALEICQQNAEFAEGQSNAANQFSATSLETLRHMVANGIGMTLMPKLAATPNRHIQYVPFKRPVPSREIGILWRKSSAKGVLLAEITDRIAKTMANENA